MTVLADWFGLTPAQVLGGIVMVLVAIDGSGALAQVVTARANRAKTAAETGHIQAETQAIFDKLSADHLKACAEANEDLRKQMEADRKEFIAQRDADHKECNESLAKIQAAFDQFRAWANETIEQQCATNLSIKTEMADVKELLMWREEEMQGMVRAAEEEHTLHANAR